MHVIKRSSPGAPSKQATQLSADLNFSQGHMQRLIRASRQAIARGGSGKTIGGASSILCNQFTQKKLIGTLASTSLLNTSRDSARKVGYFRSLATLPAHTVVPMPALSPTMETGSIAKWNLKEGNNHLLTYKYTRFHIAI
jgi:hypothetical protein